MIIYHHEHNHDKMVVLISFVVTDDSQYDDGHTNTGVDKDGTLSVHDGYGKPFVIVLSYKNCISYTRDHNSVGKKDCRWSVYDDFINHFWCC